MDGPASAPAHPRPMLERLSLAPGVHACREGEVHVLLDLRGDKYYFAPFEARDDDIVVECGKPLREITTGAAAARRLASLGLAAPSARCEPSTLSDLLEALSETSLVRACDIVHFLRACLWARQALKRRRLDIALAELALRGCRVPRTAPRAEDVAAACERFERLRPFFPERLVCLLDSLALADFLIASGVRAELVFGARRGPFAAHCWIEWGRTPLNDRMGQAESFSVILRLGW